MQVLKSVEAVREAVRTARSVRRSVGCVMTMGALHAGHRSLLDLACEETDFVAATIFVNPTQFAPHEDLDKYPRPLESDLEICRAAGVDAVFLPSVDTMYPADSQTTVSVSMVSQPLEGAHRPTHFDGVSTVVLKLLNIVNPDVAYFGQKDYQQCAVIRRMVRDLNVPVDIRTAPTIRDADGLALSSRNQYLSETEREAALKLNASLSDAEKRIAEGCGDVAAVEAAMRERLSDPAISLDYAVIVDPDSLAPIAAAQATMVALVAAKVGSTRLIDNRIIEHKPTR